MKQALQPPSDDTTDQAAPAAHLWGTKPLAVIKAATTGHAALQALTELIMQHHLMPRWLLKIDDERGGRGHAYIDVASVPAIGQALDHYSIMLSRNAGGQKPWLMQCPHHLQLDGRGEVHRRFEPQGARLCAPKLALVNQITPASVCSPLQQRRIAPRQGRYHNLSLALHMHSDRLPCRLQSPLMPLNVPKLTARLTR